MTLSSAEIIEQAGALLRAAGIENPQREARWMMESLSSEIDTATRQSRFEEMIRRRISREPLQHIIGDVEFYGIDLICDARALIPRPDSETLVDAALEILPPDFEGVVADLGTGSGCLLLAVLSNRPLASGIGIEASPEAAQLARANVEKVGLSSRAQILNCSWDDWDGWSTCDLIMSNPPYIETGVIDALEPEVRDHDPRQALDGGSDGLDAYRSIFNHTEMMKLGAALVLEIGFDQADTVPGLAKADAVEFGKLHQDLGGNPRVVTFTKTSAE